MREIADRYARGVPVELDQDFEDGKEPPIARTPEIVQALGTLVENAATFAHEKVEIFAWSDEEFVGVEIEDDGPGFPPEILARLGEPYVSTRVGDGEHMGLGVFIASTLLSRTGVLYLGAIATRAVHAFRCVGPGRVLVRETPWIRSRRRPPPPANC